MGQVLLLIITDMQLERQKVWKNPDLPLGGMTAEESRENNARLPAEGLLLTYELEQDTGAPIS